MKAPEITLDDIRARVRARFERLHAHLLRELDSRRESVAYSGGGDDETALPPERTLAFNVATYPWWVFPNQDGDRGPVTIGEAFDLVKAESEALIERTATDIDAAVLRHIPAPLRLAVLAPERNLVGRWPWPREAEAVPLGPAINPRPFDPGVMLSLLSALSPTLPPGESLPGAWPATVAPADIAFWLGGDMTDMELWSELLSPTLGHVSSWNAAAVLYAVLQAVERDQRRPAVAIDAGKVHADLLEGWRDLPKDTRKDMIREPHSGRIELLAPGKCVQLALDLGPSTLSEAMTLALRDLRSWGGLRNWAALQRLFSVEGGRQGMVRWTLDGHLEALGYSPQERTRAPVRSKIAREVEAFAHLELAAYDQHGKLRERRPLVMVGSRFERLRGSEWRLDGMELQINPLLYRGVREEGGELGSNWHPAPVELARMDHVRHPYAYSLGLILPIRWRLALAEGRDHLHYTGESVLRLAGIKYSRHDPGKAWGALERDLEELHRIGHVGRWEWVDAPRTLAGMLDLYPATWMMDRTLRGVRPVELPPGPPVLTGDELKAWRKARGLTQARAAEVLGVRKITILRAEKRPEGQLSPYLADRLKATQ